METLYELTNWRHYADEYTERQKRDAIKYLIQHIEAKTPIEARVLALHAAHIKLTKNA